MGFKMKTSIVFFLMVVGFSFSFGEKNSSENESPDKPSPRIPNEEKKIDIEPEAMEKNSNFYTRQSKPNYIITPGQKPIMDPRPHYAQFMDDDSAIPYFGFSDFENQRQNIYLSDHTGKYNLQLENFPSKKPSNFQAALGAISAHIANERNNQEYIPYPPNGDFYNYPGYRGHSRATDPPAIRTYERATNPNYYVQPVDFEQQNSRRIFSNINYDSGFSTQFRNPRLGFYSDPDFINNGRYVTRLRRSSEPVYEPQWHNLEEEYRRAVN